MLAINKSNTKDNITTLDVVMPCYNTPPEYLKSAIESVINEKSYLDQNNIVTSLIVVDDASSDSESIDCIKGFSEKYSWINALFLSTNHGPAGSRNMALKTSTSEWIAFLDSDDYWLPGAIALLWDAIKNNSTIEWISGDFYIEHVGKGKESKTFYPQHQNRFKYINQAYETNSPVRLERPVDQFMEGNLCSMGSCIISNKLLRKIGYFNASLNKGVDTELYWRLSKEADLVFSPVAVFVYRRYPGTVSHDGKNLSDWEPPILYQMLSASSWQPYHKAIRRRLLRTLINISFLSRNSRNFKKAISFSFDAVKLKPYGIRPWLAFISSASHYINSFLK